MHQQANFGQLKVKWQHGCLLSNGNENVLKDELKG